MGLDPPFEAEFGGHTVGVDAAKTLGDTYFAIASSKARVLDGFALEVLCPRWIVVVPARTHRLFGSS